VYQHILALQLDTLHIRLQWITVIFLHIILTQSWGFVSASVRIAGFEHTRLLGACDLCGQQFVGKDPATSISIMQKQLGSIINSSDAYLEGTCLKSLLGH
jgi:hypothetical protein